ncbi:MAG: hypothetical protein H5T66_01535 [Chloroflexi bacterium]|nr:hypothetical protein [Chloroflexota bacterium]
MAGKVKIIVSDLHLGAGQAEAGNALEDFTSDAAFAGLMQALFEESETAQREVELIFAGDTFEFLQVPALPEEETFDPTAHYRLEQYVASDEAASAAKMRLITAGHVLFFAALRAFLNAAPPRRTVTFIKGNHDVNLHWAAVQGVIRRALDATGPRADCLTFVERRVAREGIYVEHGHQYTERINRFPDFEEPHDPKAPDQLYLPPGSRFVLGFLNRLERERYWLDGVKPITALIWYVLALDFRFGLRALGALLGQLPTLMWGSLPVTWAVTAYLEAHERLEQEVADADRLEPLSHNPETLGDLFRRADLALALHGVPSREGEPQAAAWPDYAALPRGVAEETAQREALSRIAAHKRLQERARVIVFGHTHEAVLEDLGEGAVYCNAGTWTWVRSFAGQDFAAWRLLFKNPEQFTQERRLTYVRVDYDEAGQPHAQLLTYQPPKPQSKGLWLGFLGRLFGRKR